MIESKLKVKNANILWHLFRVYKSVNMVTFFVLEADEFVRNFISTCPNWHFTTFRFRLFEKSQKILKIFHKDWSLNFNNWYAKFAYQLLVYGTK